MLYKLLSNQKYPLHDSLRAIYVVPLVTKDYFIDFIAMPSLLSVVVLFKVLRVFRVLVWAYGTLSLST